MFENGFPPEWSTLKKLIWLRGSGAAGGGELPWATFTGNPLEFDAPKAHSLKSCTVGIEPIQSGSGDPSPDNVRPITGRTGATVWRTGENLFDKDTPIYRGQYIGSTIGIEYSRITTDYIEIFPSIDYTMSIDLDNSENLAFINYNYFDKDKTWLGNRQSNGDSSFGGQKTKTFNISNESAKYVRITLRAYSDASVSLADVTLENAELMLNLGSTASPYSPYSGTTVTITIGQTVYGGTLDVTTGVLTVDRAIVDLSMLDLPYNSAWHCWTAIREEISDAMLVNSNNTVVNAIASNMKARAASGYTSSHATGTLAMNTSGMFFFDNGSTTTLDGTLCYEVATPITVQLTPEEITAIVGRNVMWTDASNLTVEARGTAVNLNALQSLNILLGGKYVNNHTPDDVSDDEALQILLGGNNR